MTTSQALRAGIYGLRIRKRLWLWFYAISTIWALLVAGPIIGLLLASLGNSAWAEQMAGNFDIQWIAELIAGRTTLPLMPIVWVAVLVFAVASVAHLFLLGGAVGLFCEREGFFTARFFENCGRYFWRFLRLALCAASLYFIVLIIGRVLNSIGEKVWGEGSVQAPLVYWGWGRMLVLLALTGLVTLIVDYARIQLVATESRKTIRSTIASIRFVFSHFRQTTVLCVVLWMLTGFVVSAYWTMANIVQQTSMGLVMLLFVVRQITVLARIWCQLLFYSAQSEFFLASQPLPAPKVEEPAPPIPAVEEPPDSGLSAVSLG